MSSKRSCKFLDVFFIAMIAIMLSDAWDGYKCDKYGIFTSVFYGTYECKLKNEQD